MRIEEENSSQGHDAVIELTRLNGSPLAVNCDLIKYVEASPDTTLTLVTGDKIVVREACATVASRVFTYRVLLLREAGAAPGGSASACAAAQNASSALAAASLPRSEEEEERSR